jgi:hypothetical protein
MARVLCSECDRLWQELACAVQADRGMLIRLRTAESLRDSVSIAEVKMYLRETEETRANARKAAKDHEITHSQRRAAAAPA